MGTSRILRLAAARPLVAAVSRRSGKASEWDRRPKDKPVPAPQPVAIKFMCPRWGGRIR
jgi:hypothetical protein